jgi:hypothetical protein
MTVKLIKTITGNHSVSYPCPNCGDQLRNPIREVGLSDTCPKCKQSIRVPTSPEVQDFIRQLATDRNSKLQSKQEREEAKAAAKAAKAAAAAAKSQPAPTNNPLPYANALPYGTGISQPYSNQSRRGSSRSTTDNDDLVTWAVRTTRSMLKVILVVWWIIVGLSLVVGLVQTGMLLYLTNGSGSTNGLMVAAVTLIFVLLGATLSGLLGTVVIGTIGVLFEIEENTRR